MNNDSIFAACVIVWLVVLSLTVIMCRVETVKVVNKLTENQLVIGRAVRDGTGLSITPYGESETETNSETPPCRKTWEEGERTYCCINPEGHSGDCLGVSADSPLTLDADVFKYE